MNLPEPYASAPTPVTDNHSRVYQTAGMPLAYLVLLDLSCQLERRLAYAEAQLEETKKRDFNNHVCIHHTDLERAAVIGHCLVCKEKERDEAQRKAKAFDWLLQNIYVIQTDAGCHDLTLEALESAMKK